MGKLARRICLYVFVLIFLFIGYIRYLESHSIFYPSREITVIPANYGMPFKEVYIKAKDNVTINGWWIPQDKARATLLFLHGNAGNIMNRMEKILRFREMGLNVLIIDYRGYGKSQGKPTEKGIYKDADAAYDYLAQFNKDGKIVCYGESLGGAVAVNLAAHKKVSALIVDASFTNAADMARLKYSFVPSFLIQTKLNSLMKVPKIIAPKLFIHSIDDDVVPFALGRKLYDAAQGPKEFLEIRGSHNQGHIVSEKIYWEGIEKFLNKYVFML